MASKNLVGIFLNGGVDGINFMTARDSETVSLIQTYRQSAPNNIPNFTEAVTKTGNLTVDSNVITNINTTGIVVGDNVYGVDLSARRGLNVTAIDAGASTVTLNGVAYSSHTGTTLYFATAGVSGFSSKMFKLNESNNTGKNPALHYSQRFFWDTFNVLDTVGNAGKVKSAVVFNIGPRIKKIERNVALNRDDVVLPNGTRVAATAADGVPQIESHNDQQSIWQSTKTEGAVEGLGGSIADKLLPEIPLQQNKALLSVTASGSTLFSTGSEVFPFAVSPNGLVRKIPGILGRVTTDSTLPLATSLNTLFYQAMRALPANDDFATSVDATNSLAQEFQNILSDDNIPQITSVPSILFNIQTETNSNVSGFPLASSLRTLLRVLLANNPNRGGIATRSGNLVTVETEITAGVANRTAGSNVVTITAAGHGLFTSNTNSADHTDSVIVLGNPTAIDTSISANGYKITLLPSDVNNKFTFTGTATTALVDVPVTVRLKHNLSTNNSVFIKSADTVLSRIDPYPITTIVNSTSFTFTTTASGAFSTPNLPIKFKLIDLPKQILYADSGGWDSHNEPNHSQLAALDGALTYFNGIAERIVDAEIATILMSEFGRTLGTNSRGTDHGYGSNMACFGKPIKGNKVYGQIPSLVKRNAGGVNASNNALEPSTAVYQYIAPFAKWLGLNDAQVLEVFPDLNNWPANERYLDII